MSWSGGSVSKVVRGGARSPKEMLANTVFRGTVFGPLLRNLFYADARFAVNARGFTETVFADDFNCWRPVVITRDQIYPAQVVAFAALQESQHELHLCGEANRAVFDLAKELFHLLPRKVRIRRNF